MTKLFGILIVLSLLLVPSTASAEELATCQIHVERARWVIPYEIEEGFVDVLVHLKVSRPSGESTCADSYYVLGKFIYGWLQTNPDTICVGNLNASMSCTFKLTNTNPQEDLWIFIKNPEEFPITYTDRYTSWYMWKIVYFLPYIFK